MGNLSNDERKIIYFNCTDLQNQLRVDGIYYYNFQVYLHLLCIMVLMIVFINGLCLIAMTKTSVLSNSSNIVLKCMVTCDLLTSTLRLPSLLNQFLPGALSLSLSLSTAFLYEFLMFSGDRKRMHWEQMD